MKLSAVTNPPIQRTGVDMKWSGWNTQNVWTGQPRKYRINLVNGGTNGYDLSYAGELTYTPFGMAYILGGLNTWGNPDVRLSPMASNAVCAIGAAWNALLNINQGRGYGCTVTFAAQTSVFKRAQDPDDPTTWVVESK